MADRMKGGCICGAVRFSAVPKGHEMGACHCGLCRRWTGGAGFLGVECGVSVEVEGEPALGVYKSSEYGERVFCSTCGSTLFWRMQDGSDTVVSSQAFDEPGSFRFASEIFIDEKPDNYAFANDTKKMTSAEFFAAIASQQD